MTYILIIIAFFLINYDMEDAFWNALAKAGGSTYLFMFILREVGDWLLIIVKAIVKH